MPSLRVRAPSSMAVPSVARPVAAAAVRALRIVLTVALVVGLLAPGAVLGTLLPLYVADECCGADALAHDVVQRRRVPLDDHGVPGVVRAELEQPLDPVEARFDVGAQEPDVLHDVAQLLDDLANVVEPVP